MKPVFQSIVDSEDGDCMRAVIASLLELDLSQVPHFGLFEKDRWWKVMYYFLYSFDLKYVGCIAPRESNSVIKKLDVDCSIGGYFYASVPSRTFGDESKGHAVVMDMNGKVAHDPNPNKLWLGEVINPGPILDYYLIKAK